MASRRLDRITSEARKHHLIANALCLDFANTLYGHGGKPVHEYLASYNDLVVWSHRAGILTEATAERLVHLGDRHPKQAESVFRRAIALREMIFRVFDALAHGKRPQAADVETLNSSRYQALAHSRIQPTPAGFALAWDAPNALDRMLWPIALAAGDLVTSPQVERVRECGGETCDWLFVDTSRNHLRRWCSMKECGNRAKARRFLERQRTAGR
jgi:predicted RNA-binding Zn ribbon-like protein